jgi:hypothetical protein
MMRIRQKKLFLAFVLVFIFIGLSLPKVCFAQAQEERIKELQRKLEELEKMVIEYKSLLRELLEERKATKKIAPKEVVPEPKVVAKKEPPPEKPSVWSKYDMQLFGRIKIDIHYDDVAFEKYNDFIGVIAAYKDYKKDSIDFNPRDTRLGFKVSHELSRNWIGDALFEGDFYGDINGNNIEPRLRLAYIDVKNPVRGTSFRIGQDWVPVAQQNPKMSEFGILAAGGNLWWRVPQLTVIQMLGNFELLGSVMRHRRESAKNDGNWPWVLGRIAYNIDYLGPGNMIAVGFGYCKDEVEIDEGFNLRGKEIDVNRWLAALELSLKKGDFELIGESWVGQGIGPHWLRYDMDLNPITGEEIRSQGGFLSLFYNTPIKKLSLGIGAGIDNATNSDLNGWDFLQEEDGGKTGLDYNTRYSRNMQFYLNLWYELSPALKLIGEWIHMETERFDDTRGGNRFTISAFYNF